MAYNSTSSGYNAAKNSIAWSTTRQFGVLRLRGSDVLDFLNRLTTNRIDNLSSRQGRQSVLPNEKGRIIDVLTILSMSDETIVLTSAGRQNEVAAWLKKYIVMDDVKITDSTSMHQFIEILGPAAVAAIPQLFGIEVFDLPTSHWQTIRIAGEDVIVFRAPAPAETSYVFMSLKELQLEKMFFDAGLSKVCDHEFNTLRIEAGIPVIDKELSSSYNPLEAGLVQIIDFKKGCYIGQEVIARIDSYNKVQKRLIGFMSESEVLEGDSIVFDGGVAGHITSATFSPEFGHIALGYIRGDAATHGAIVLINGENKAKISNLPFAAA